MRYDPAACPIDPDLWRPDLPTPDNADLLRWYWAAAQQLRPDPVCVEIGVSYGRSLLWLASRCLETGRAGATLFGTDTWDQYPPIPGGSGCVASRRAALGQLHAHGLDTELEMVRILNVPSSDAARLWPARSVDLVLIDGDHSLRGVRADIEHYLPLIRPGGCLAGHDYGASWPGVVSAVDELLGRRARHYERVWWVEYPAA